MGEKRPYIPPEAQMVGLNGDRSPSEPKEKKEYVPPVGPESKSLPPTGDWRDLPPGLLPKLPRRK